MKKIGFALAAFIIITGCSNRISPVAVPMGSEATAGLSSGVIGCPSKEIRTMDEVASYSGTYEWIAECRGKQYVCSYVYGSTTTCKEYVK